MGLLELRGLHMHFPLGGLASWVSRTRGEPTPVVRAVDGVSLSIDAGETVALVGESGCGKSTVARCLVRLLEPTSGQILYRGHDIANLKESELRPLRRSLQMVYQDPTASLNPRLSARRVVEEPLRLHDDSLDAAARSRRVIEVMEEVGLGADLIDRYPHELSGGQRQRVNIARAIATRPDLVVLDEPTSALDVSLRSRAILLLESLRTRFGLAYLFISHDLATVKYLAQRVAVMYLGVVVEMAPVRELFSVPLHPYTRALLSAVPVPEPGARRERFVLSGEIPSPTSIPEGCRLRGRCPVAKPVCAEPVALREVAPGRHVACHLV